MVVNGVTHKGNDCWFFLWPGEEGHPTESFRGDSVTAAANGIC